MLTCLITATRGRHEHLERCVRFSLNQTSKDWVHLIYNNSPEKLILDRNLPDKYILVNNNISLSTKEPYSNLGDIYTDAITYIPSNVDVITFMDDDDIYLPNHVEEGINGLQRGGKKAYKPQKSYYKHSGGISLVENTLEPSIFVLLSHIKEHGFSQETSAQHLKWVNPLVYNQEIYVDKDGPSTYICDWSQELPTFKTSGNPHTPSNFNNYVKYSVNNGDRIITPISDKKAKKYYDLSFVSTT